MAYTLFMGENMFPIPPSKLTIKINNQNDTISLINEGEINLLKRPGLTDISFSLLIPNVSYPFAQYEGGFKSADYFLEVLEKLKTQSDSDGKIMPFQFILSRSMPNGKVLFDTNIKASLETYKIIEDAENGFDINVDIELKQYRPYGVKTVTIKEPASKQSKPVAKVEQSRPSENVPKATSHEVVKGDSLWAIAQKMLGDGSRYPEIYALNKDSIDNQNKGTGNSKYTIYPGQNFKMP